MVARAGNSIGTPHSIGDLGIKQSRQGLLRPSDKVDIYKFTLSRSKSYSADLQQLSVNADLQLLNQAGSVVKTSSRRGIRSETLTGNLAAGTYYLRVVLKGRGRTTYQLNASAASSVISGDGINSEERQLYDSINQYRAQNNLPAIPLSKALSTVANRHVLDLENNIGYLTHGWSNAPYDANDSSTYPSMWGAPQRLNTGYPGNGYENAFGGTGSYVATAEAAFSVWKNSPGHNEVILNQRVWKNFTWNALGVGIYQGFAVIWFGAEPDPTGQPASE